MKPSRNAIGPWMCFGSLAELYRTRNFIRAASGRNDGLVEDVRQFELLSRIVPRTFWFITAAPDFAGTSRSARSAVRRQSRFPVEIDFEHRLVERAEALEHALPNSCRCRRN